MAHFAKLNENNVVISVHPIADENCLDENGNESEEVGINYCKSFYGQDTNWKQTSYNHKIRHRYAGVGYSYSEEHDVFLTPKNYPSWNLNTENYEWEPPVPMPDLTDEQTQEGKYYEWNEEIVNWELKQITQ